MKNVMVVEDDDTIRELVTHILSEEGYKVTSAENGAVALKLLKNPKREPCLILLDLMMPELNGWEFLEIIQKTDSLAVLPIVILSAVAPTQIPKSVLKVYKKPIDMDILLKMVYDICGAP